MGYKFYSQSTIASSGGTIEPETMNTLELLKIDDKVLARTLESLRNAIEILFSKQESVLNRDNKLHTSLIMCSKCSFCNEHGVKKTEESYCSVDKPINEGAIRLKELLDDEKALLKSIKISSKELTRLNVLLDKTQKLKESEVNLNLCVLNSYCSILNEYTNHLEATKDINNSGFSEFNKKLIETEVAYTLEKMAFCQEMDCTMDDIINSLRNAQSLDEIYKRLPCKHFRETFKFVLEQIGLADKLPSSIFEK